MKPINNLFWYLFSILVVSITVAIYAVILWVNTYAFVFTLLASYIINILTALIIFSQKRHSSAKLSWMLFVIIVPLIGHVLYFSLGQKYPHRRDYLVVQSEMDNDTEIIDEKMTLASKEEVTFNHLSIYNKTAILNGEIKTYEMPNDYFNDLFLAIEEAKNEVWLVSYWVESGHLFDELAFLLLKKQKQGVNIRWLVDDYGRRNVKNHQWNELKKQGINIVFIGKLKFTFFLSSNLYRNHRKFILIDSKILFNGGSNIADQYVSLNPGYGIYRDFNYRIKGTYVYNYIKLFVQMWRRWADQDLTTNYNIKKLVVKSKLEATEKQNSLILSQGGPEIDDPVLEETIVKLISRAEDEIKIMSPYFSLPNNIISALKVALLSGVKVTLYFPGFSRQKLVSNISLFELNVLLRYGMTVYLSNNYFNHSKAGVFDNKIAYLGTMNFDIRSFYAQYETIDIIQGETVSDIVKYMQKVESESKKLTVINTARSFSWPKKIFYAMLKSIV
ncbi:phospholipase D-like domain-containing protein [Mycoplasmopsis agassizii]|uniref:PLD phosphodiesterase domain-containing protein n=1 Tax=Mycoplasmopsis agassizii TaxID=33922 RepID=A0ABX4H4H0_9BACT|nr:phospholipase D-like domain-containing protein [Mycoplasmopsis agassizii]PAF54784.1 hypothetical protein CJF60_03540 [Mycoplasmopsis agassizii]SMC19604.1 cardiolipin synthase [Mycoplasmopsis agassizii]